MSTLSRDAVRELREALVGAGPVCAAGDADLFTGPDAFEPERAGVRRARERRAKKVCLSCPARPECLSYALAIRPDEGVWAGLTFVEVRALSLRLASVPDKEVA